MFVALLTLPFIHSSADRFLIFIFFFFNDTATTEIYTLSLHDALPIWNDANEEPARIARERLDARIGGRRDRKSTRLNSSHEWISYAVFCLKKKKKIKKKIGVKSSNTSSNKYIMRITIRTEREMMPTH